MGRSPAKTSPTIRNTISTSVAVIGRQDGYVNDMQRFGTVIKVPRPASRDITTVVGNFSDVADQIVETAAKTARAIEISPEVGRVAVD